MIRRYRWWLAGGALVLVAGLVALFTTLGGPEPGPVDEPGPPGDGPLTIVSMGDSTLSGEGAGDYTPKTNGQGGNWCHRSPHATVKQTAVPGIAAKINFACSGAPADQVSLGDVKQWTEPSQAGQLAGLVDTHQVVAIVVAIGANDEPQFSRLLNECFQAWFNDGSEPCSVDIAKDFQERVDAMVPQVVDALEDIKSVLDKAGYEPEDTDIVLESYASPISPDIPENLRNLNGCPFRTEDLRWVKQDGVRILADGLREAAERAGVRFLDLSRAGDGHEACTGGADPSTEWFRRLTVQWNDLTQVERASHAIQESFHPNARGHAQFGRCLTEFLGSAEPASACLAGSDGNLHPAPSPRAP